MLSKLGCVKHQCRRGLYLAQHTLMNEPQVLKFLPSELSHDEAFTAGGEIFHANTLAHVQSGLS